jgi:hypothetical protein
MKSQQYLTQFSLVQLLVRAPILQYAIILIDKRHHIVNFHIAMKILVIKSIANIILLFLLVKGMEIIFY